MPAISIMTYWLGQGLILWLAVLAFLAVWPLLSGRFGMRGIFLHPRTNSHDPERVLLLFLTIGAAVYYLITGIGLSAADICTPEDPSICRMPDFPQELLFVLFGAQGGYISGRILRFQKGPGV